MTVTNERNEKYDGFMIGLGLFLATAKVVDYPFASVLSISCKN